MDIKITITNKHCTVQGAPVIVCGNSGYTMTFTFDAEWAAAGKKTARFSYVRDGKRRHKDVQLIGDTVTVPAVYKTRELQVGVYAGDLVTSTPARIPCKKSIVCDSCEPDNLFPGQVEQIEQDILDKVCPPFAESGAVVTCRPVKGYPLEVITHVPVEAAGETLTLRHTGKNLWDFKSGLSWVTGCIGGTTGNAVNRYGYFIRMPAGQYVIHAELNDNSAATGNDYIYLNTVDNETMKMGSQNTLVVPNTFSTVKISLADNQSIFIYDAGRQAENAVNEGYSKRLFYEYVNIQIEAGTVETPYEPYFGVEKTIELPEMHLDGTYNWTTGEFFDGQTTQLSPQAIVGFPGVNNFWSSAGDTEVTGKADPVAVIADLYDKINKLQAAAVNNA